MRLNKYLAGCGLGSRRNVEQYIIDGKVTVNGKRVTELATDINEHKDMVRYNGRVVQVRIKKIYIILNKPRGIVTTVNDDRDRKTVMDLVKIHHRIFPVGRLDLKSEGLLLMTNDGELANRLTHPSYKVAKTYRVRLTTPFKPDDFDAIFEGIELEDGMTAPAKAKYYTDAVDRLEITIKEGRNRQIRRMMEALGYEVKNLKRVKFGPLVIGKLGRGEWRHLTPVEVKSLKTAAKLYKS